MIVEQFPGRTLLFNNTKHLYFGGTSYLGLPANKKFQKTIAKNIKKWGSAYGSSRNANIQLSVYEVAEQELAKFIQSEAAVTVSSGMLAGKIVVEVLKQENATFYHFPNVHTALQTLESLPFFEKEDLHPTLTNNKKEKVVLLTDSYPTSSVLPIDLQAIQKISPSKEIILVIDESHSLGVTGVKGCGEFASLHFPNIQSKIMIASLGKAMGVNGGIIAGDSRFIEVIKNHPTFIAAAGMNPAFLSSLASSLSFIQKRQQKLLKNLSYLKTLLPPDADILFNEKYPLIYPKDENFYYKCLSQKIVIVNFTYSTPSGNVNRIVITANHKKKDLEALANVFNL